MWHEDKRYPGEEILVDPEGQVHRLRPILPNKWKIKYASSTNKPAEMKAAKLNTLQELIRGNVPSSFDNGRTRQTKAASSTDKITVDFVVNEKYKSQRKNDDRFAREVEAMRTVKRLQSLQESYRNRGIVI